MSYNIQGVIMNILHRAGEDIVLDDEGFLNNTDDWDEAVAAAIARREGIGQLDGEKMLIVKMLRDYHRQHESFPILANICRKIGSKTKDCIIREFINPMKAWKIAGLPKPPEVFFTSFDGKHYFANPFY